MMTLESRSLCALWLALGAVFLLSTTGCGDETSAAKCVLPEDCGPGQTCAFRGAGGSFDEFADGSCVAVECRRDVDCPDGQCIEEVCYSSGAPTDPGGDTCRRDRDCAAGQICDSSGTCVADSTPGDVTDDDTTTPDVEDEPDTGTPPDVTPGDTQDEPAPEVCDPPCALGFECIGGECVEQSVNGCSPACDTGFSCIGGQCIPDNSNCDLTAADCVDPTPYLTYAPDGTCRCSGCAQNSDCNTAVGEICIQQGGRGRCIFTTGQTCQSRTDCGQGYCQAGQCTQCLSEQDCPNPSDICIRGRCGQCECPGDLVCDLLGNCVEPIDGSTCSTPSDCVLPAQQLGWSGDASLLGCDQTLGCYVMGQCNGILGGNDPFGGACAAGSSCAAPSSLADFFRALIEGSVTQKCACDPSGPNVCRQGETCQEELLLIIPTGSYSCQPANNNCIPGTPFCF